MHFHITVRILLLLLSPVAPVLGLYSAGANCNATNKCRINIVMLFPREVAESSYNITYGAAAAIADISMTNYTASLISKDTNCEQEGVLNSLLDLNLDASDELNVLLGPMCSEYTSIAYALARRYNVPLLSLSSFDMDYSDKNKFPNFVRFLPRVDSIVPVVTELLAHFNWRRVGLLSSSEDNLLSLSESLGESLLAQGIILEAHDSFTSHNDQLDASVSKATAYHEGNKEFLQTNIVEPNINIVLILATDGDLRSMLVLLKQLVSDYSSKLVVVVPRFGLYFTSEDFFRFTKAASSWMRPITAITDTAAREATVGILAPVLAPASHDGGFMTGADARVSVSLNMLAYDAVMALTQSVEATRGAVTTATVLRAMRNISFAGKSGALAFDASLDRQPDAFNVLNVDAALQLATVAAHATQLSVFPGAAITWPHGAAGGSVPLDDYALPDASLLSVGSLLTYIALCVMLLLLLLSWYNGYLAKIRYQLYDTGDSWKIDYEDLKIGKKLGAGSYGTVFEGKWRGKAVAIKKFDQQDMNEANINDFIMEIAVLKELRHPNCVLFMACCFETPNLCIVTELLKGSLYDLIESCDNDNEGPVCLPWSTRLSIMLDAALGMTYLHQSGILHHDLKSPNLLLGQYNTCKVADFGMTSVRENKEEKFKLLRKATAQHNFVGKDSQEASPMKKLMKKSASSFNLLAKQTSTVAKSLAAKPSRLNVKILEDENKPAPSPSKGGAVSVAGTAMWTAPEVIEGEAFTEKADVYSFGIILAEIVNLSEAYPNESGFTVSIKVVSESYRPTLSTACPAEIVKVAEKCWHADPEQRPSFAEAVEELQVIEKEWSKLKSKDSSSADNSLRRWRRKSVSGRNLPFAEKPAWFIEESYIEMTTKVVNAIHGEIYEGRFGEVVKANNKPKDIGDKIKSRLGSTIGGSVFFGGGGAKTGLHGSKGVVPESTPCMVRVLDAKPNSKTVKAFVATMDKLMQLKHENLLTIYGGCVAAPSAYLVTERAVRGTLQDVLDVRLNKLTWKRRFEVLLQVVEAIAYLHENKAMHSAIKGNNIFMFENSRVKLGDFNLLGLYKTIPSKTNKFFVPSWNPPEALMFDEYLPASDVYSVGILMWVLITREQPFKNTDFITLARVICSENLRPTPPHFNDVEGNSPATEELCSQYVALMQRCWVGEASDRPASEELLNSVQALKEKLPL